jgi:hypothetical protein
MQSRREALGGDGIGQCCVVRGAEVQISLAATDAPSAVGQQVTLIAHGERRLAYTLRLIAVAPSKGHLPRCRVNHPTYEPARP